MLSSIIVPPTISPTSEDVGIDKGDSTGWTLITGASDNHIKVRLPRPAPDYPPYEESYIDDIFHLFSSGT